MLLARAEHIIIAAPVNNVILVAILFFIKFPFVLSADIIILIYIIFIVSRMKIFIFIDQRPDVSETRLLCGYLAVGLNFVNIKLPEFCMFGFDLK